jgi:hypothetical protein
MGFHHYLALILYNAQIEKNLPTNVYTKGKLRKEP